MIELATFAARAGIELVAGDALAAICTGDFRDDPSIDYGRIARRMPSAVLRPRDQRELRACMAFLFAANIPYKTRGAGHSSGGQALIADGVVIDLRQLDRIVADDPERETITVEGGAWWLAVVEHLYAQGRRPRSITANLRSSVAGTLAVGGFGDSSHLWGLQISHVERLSLIQPDGTTRELGPGDELFRYALAGRGQLGVIGQASLQTIRQPWTMVGRMLRWRSLADFVTDSAVIAERALYDFVRARVVIARDGSEQIVAHVGRTCDGAELAALADSGAPQLRAEATPTQRIDLHALLTAERHDAARLACPALELVLPLPDGLAAWRELAVMIGSAGIPALQPDGHSVMVVARDPRFPLAPLPPSAPTSVMLALRPKLAIDDAPALLPALRAIGRRAMAVGARLYLMSIELDEPTFLDRQFGEALPRLRALKAELDPRGLLNPGLLA